MQVCSQRQMTLAIIDVLFNQKIMANVDGKQLISARNRERNLPEVQFRENETVAGWVSTTHSWTMPKLPCGSGSFPFGKPLKVWALLFYGTFFYGDPERKLPLLIFLSNRGLPARRSPEIVPVWVFEKPYKCLFLGQSQKEWCNQS